MVIIADDFDASKGYKRIAFREDRDLLDTELNELQAIAIHERSVLMDRLFAPGSIVAGLDGTVNGDTVLLNAGMVYLDGHAVSVPEGTLEFSDPGIHTIWLDVFRRIITVADDPTLVNPLTGEPTAEREKWIATLQTRDTTNDPWPEGAIGRTVVALYAFNRDTGELLPIVPRVVQPDDPAWLAAHIGHGGVEQHPVVTPTEAGFMAPADKTKLDQLSPNTPPTHTHDERYYPRGDADALLATKAPVGHAHDTAYAPLAHVGAAGTAHPTATTGQPGFLSATDKAKLDGIAAGATVGRRAVTLTIAADDALPASQQMADVVCTGVADEVVINAALATLTAGGTVVLTEGIFHLTGAIIVPSSVVLAGQGEATVLRLIDAVASGCTLLTNQQADTGKDYGIVIRDLTLDGNRANQSPTGWKGGILLKNVYRSAVERCFVKQIYGEGILLESGAFNRIEECHVERCVLTGITIKWSDFTNVWNNRAYRNEEYGIENQASSGGQIRGNLVAGNRFEGIYAIGVDLDVCNNRAFLNGQVGGTENYNIYVSGRGLVAFNIVRSDFTETGGIGQGWFALVQAYEGVNAGSTHTTSKGLYVGGGAFCIANDVYAGGINADLTLTSDEWNPTVQQANRTTSTPRTNPGTWD